MARNWTGQQKRAIELHNSNILVSAAAGSGKTAVLVERIIQMLTRTPNPVDVERLVIVTFTNAAAAEMRERISNALEELIENNPSDRYLQRQLAMLHIAQITTIDSFCLNILRNNYMNINLDPGFRIADAGELELLKADVMEEMLEKCYAEGDDDFYALVDAYSGKKSDIEIENLIKNICDYARSYPWPDEWLDLCEKTGRVKTVGEFDNTMPVKYLYDYVMRYLKSSQIKFRHLLDICNEPAGPDMYIDNIQDDLEKMDMMLCCTTFSEWAEVASKVTFTDLSRKKGTGTDTDLKELVKLSRTQYRDTFRKICSKLCGCSIEEYLEQSEQNGAPVEMLIKLARRYMHEVDDAKREKNLIDFNDMEHMALKLLVDKADGEIVYTRLADELSEYYEEILVDEYQDSNLLQEQILTAVSRSRKSDEENNMFMVGDVKQSIYKFRLARPDLFIEKYDSYPDKADCEMIELHKNFRSRPEVLESVNVVFKDIMQKECGGIEYTDNVRLNPGLEFEKTDKEYKGQYDNRTLIKLIDTSDLTGNGENTPRECEGREIARIIRELTDEDNGMKVMDSGSGIYRTARYSDIVVLTRSVDGWADVFANELMNQGIPAMAQSSSGYYDTFEIEQVLNVLAVIDNPLQDIPLTAVLTSYFGTLTINELARIRSESRRGSIYNALMHYINTYENDDFGVKDFMDRLSKYRRKAEYLSISELIWQIIYDTGFYDFVGGMPAGQLRQTNLDMLCDKAKSYEKTSYHGLFNFLRYIDKVKRFDLDNSAQGADSSNMELVQIMSIHKSKGLEFPIVIIAGMAKEFNNMDARGSVIVDSDIGVGADIIDPVLRTRTTTPVKAAVEMKILDDNLAEEIRILYVAMTRAKEKLILTGTIKNCERSLKKWGLSDVSSLTDLRACHTYFDLVMPVAMKDALHFEIVSDDRSAEYAGGADAAQENADNENVAQENVAECADGTDATQADVAEDAVQGIIAKNTAKEASEEENAAQPNVIKAYPYEYAAAMKTKMSVSEIKHFEYEAEKTEEFIREDEPGVHKEDEPFEPTIPEFISRKEEMHPAQRGTAYHRVMECLDYNYAGSLEKIKEYMDKMVEEGLMTERQKSAVEPEKIFAFCQSSLGKRVAKAFSEGRLYREKPFVMGIPAGRIKCYQELIDNNTVTAEKLDEETVLIQGVIDLFFEENGKIILADYKTDRVRRSDGAQVLKDHYTIQLEYYAEAIERVLGKKVTEKLIYSFTLDEIIPVAM